MIRQTTDLSQKARLGYDAIVDVRSPGEFAEDHLPGAINLPVLDDAQRAKVGALYVQQSKFLARRTGAAYVAVNIASHLQTALADRDGGFRPLVYCWRGGQRSGAMVTVMDQVGWPVTRLEGGYQTWRRQVVSRLYDGHDDALRVILLGGGTGTGKTQILSRLQARGVQTLDLERLAEHRGSLFGATGTPQPSQKLFESRLYEGLADLDLSRPVIVEAESSRIGNITLPPKLWSAMKRAPRCEITAPLDARVDHILQGYGDVSADRLDAALQRLPRHLSKERIQAWRDMGRTRRLTELATELITEHYDPAYRRAVARSETPNVPIALDGASDAEFDRAAQRIAEMLEAIF